MAVKVYNNTKNVWKQKAQESRAFRFTGEPVPKIKKELFRLQAGLVRMNEHLDFNLLTYLLTSHETIAPANKSTDKLSQANLMRF